MKRLNRADSKWLHPELVEEGLGGLPDALALFEGVDRLSEAEIDSQQLEISKAMYEAFDESGDADWNEWRKTGEYTEYFTEHGCPEEPDAKPVRIIVRKPKDIRPSEKLPAVFVVPGGGLVGSGTAEMGEIYGAFSAMWPKRTRAVAVNFTYRLAPAHKYPAAINDCHAAYIWMIEHAEELQIDVNKIVITGGSSGAHLSLCIAFRLKRYDWCGAPMPRGIVANTPVMDDVAFTNSFAVSFEDENGKIINWACESIEKSMKMWLGDDLYGKASLSPEAVPARATLEDVKGYPPVWIPVSSEFEPSRDSVIRFASLLYEAGVFCDLHVWGGGTHLTMSAKTTPLGKRISGALSGALNDALKYDFRRPWLAE